MLKFLITLPWTLSLNTLSLGEDDDDYDDDNLTFTEHLVFARHYSMNLIYFA